MKKLLLVLPLILFGSCAHISPIVNDIKACASESSALHDTEINIGPVITQILECDPTLSTSTLPACAENALASLVDVLGYDGIRFVQCVVAKIANGNTASTIAQVRAKAYVKKHMVQ